MLSIYNIALQLYFLFIRTASLFNKKARLWIEGRKKQAFIRLESSAWFHFASLGEFEQGRPVLEKMRELHPDKKIVITFFSPSGYEIRKNTPLADAVYYLPLDTAANARKFIDAINPEIAVFTKYEYWYHFFNELHKRHISLYIISGIFRPGQIFFKWYGGLHRKILGFVNHFFVQNEQSVELLKAIGISNITISGDTRFDRVWANAQKPKELPLVERFIQGKKVFIAGSTWPEDERLVSFLPELYPEWKFIIAPHEIGEEKIDSLVHKFPDKSVVRHSILAKSKKLDTERESEVSLYNHLSKCQSLIIDNIGILSSLYQYGKIAYIGGGFGVGIHNTLEAAAFGLPVIFGPNYDRFKEAKDLIQLGCGFSIKDEVDLQNTVKFLLEDEARYLAICQKTKDYVRGNTGATDAIIKYIS
jgi:3-deoxy-D-manno-octulosonic-acid transferase